MPRLDLHFLLSTSAAQAAAEARFESERTQRDLARRELAQREAEFAAKRRAVQLPAEETAAGSWARFKSAAPGGGGDAPAVDGLANLGRCEFCFRRA